MISNDPEIAALAERLDALEKRQAEEFVPQLEWVRGRFSPTSGYLRAEAIPQLTGDVTHLAGTEPILVSNERFQLLDTTDGSIQVDQGEDLTIISSAETGVLIGISVVVSKYTASGGTADVLLRTNFDNSSDQDYQFVFADRKWGAIVQGLVRVGATPQSGDVQGHAFYYPIGLSYESAITVSIHSTVVSAFTGEYDLAVTVYRGRLV